MLVPSSRHRPNQQFKFILNATDPEDRNERFCMTLSPEVRQRPLCIMSKVKCFFVKDENSGPPVFSHLVNFDNVPFHEIQSYGRPIVIERFLESWQCLFRVREDISFFPNFPNSRWLVFLEKPFAPSKSRNVLNCFKPIFSSISVRQISILECRE